MDSRRLAPLSSEALGRSVRFVRLPGPLLVALLHAGRALGAGTGRSNARRDVSGFITSPHQQTAARRLEPAAQQPDQRGYNARGDEAVEAVHQSAVPRDEVA